MANFLLQSSSSFPDSLKLGFPQASDDSHLSILPPAIENSIHSYIHTSYLETKPLDPKCEVSVIPKVSTVTLQV